MMESFTDTGRWNRNDLDYRALVNEWHVVAKSSEVTAERPFACTLLGERLVLWRSEGAPLAWADYCPHRGAPLSLGRIKECRIACPYHGWEYDALGRRVHVPAHPELSTPLAAPIRQFKVAEAYGFVWVCIGEPRRNIPRIPKWDDGAYRKSFAGPYLFRANALRCIDNFIDASHFPFVHSGINGRPEEPDTTIDYDVMENGGELQTSEFSVVQPDADARGIQLRVHYRYYCLAPTVAYSDKDTGSNEHWFTWAAVTPVDRDESKFWLVMCFNHRQEIREEDIQRRQSRIFDDGDRWIVESQRPVQMPLGISPEMHVKSDRLGVAYRKWVYRLAKDSRSSISEAESEVT
jgi:phenylpropionate dioxygenase-like ring-hydroxylating dioxygenase large terminal subunit